jgi:hypothetical protein
LWRLARILSGQERRARLAWEKQERRFDEQFGVDTIGKIQPERLALAGPNAEHARAYEPSRVDAFRDVIGQLPLDFAHMVFVDFGSGKGRIVLAASEFPFQRIVGVELSAKLHAAAQANCRNYRNPERKCDAIELLCLDATAYVIPADPAVFFFYNPFDREVMARVADNICRSLREAPRPAFIVYFNPVDADVWAGRSELQPWPIRQPSVHPTAPSPYALVWNSRPSAGEKTPS